MVVSNTSQAHSVNIKQSVDISNLKRAMASDAQAVTSLLEGIKAANSKTVEGSVTPHKGTMIDVRI